MVKIGKIRNTFGRLRLVVLAFALSVVGACTTLPRNALPVEHFETATLVGMPHDIRAQGLTHSTPLQHDFAQAMVDGGLDGACDERGGQPVFCVLVVSGGGGMGAYGAGILNGWTASGERPQFKIVTGVSTGALIAPFAFLGAEWDDQLRDAFTTIDTDEDILALHDFFGILSYDSVADTAPLLARLNLFVTDEMLSDIAREHRSGRRLYIGTTNMDTQRFTVWNMGAIANSGVATARDLFVKVLLASASIPIVMPPVMFEVEVDGEVYDEMHSDGGVQAQFFVPLRVIDLPAAIKEAQAAGFNYTPTPRMFVIRNSKFIPEAKQVERNLTDMVGRTLSSMIQSMGRSDLYQIYAVAMARGNDFRYTEVPADFVWGSDQEFDGPEMRRLYAIGHENGQSEETWARTPPGLFSVNTASVP